MWKGLSIVRVAHIDDEVCGWRNEMVDGRVVRWDAKIGGSD